MDSKRGKRMAENKIFAYVRVSSKDQNLDRQIDSLRKYVVSERDIFADKLSGKNFDRPQYQALKATLREGDTLYIHSLDRLGRNKAQVKNELKALHDQGIIVRILDLPTTLVDYTDFGTLHRSIFDMVNNILIEVLSTMAEAERQTIHKRQVEGIEAAKRKGKKFGRPLITLPETWAEDYRRWKAGEISAVSLYRDKYKISRACFYVKVKNYEAEQVAATVS